MIIRKAGFVYRTVTNGVVGKILSDAMWDIGWEKTTKDFDSLNLIHLLVFAGSNYVFDNESDLFRKILVVNKIRGID